MMTLDQRARQAVGAVEAATAAYEPRSGLADVSRRRAQRRAVGVAAVGLAVFVALIAGSWFAGPFDNDLAESPPPTVPKIDEQELPKPSDLDTPPAPVTPLPDQNGPPAPNIPAPDEPSTPDPGGSEPDGEVLVLPPTTPPVTEPPPLATTTTTTTTIPPDTTPPVLAITSPEDGQTFDRKTVRFKGTTEPGATVTAGKYVADVDEEGNWSIVLVLFDGGNRALFRATDAAGNESTARITVYYDKPVDEPPPDVEFTAHATFGSCSFDPPYDVYYGKAAPGSKVTITSEYGGGSTRANDDGHWEVKVFFPEAPIGVTRDRCSRLYVSRGAAETHPTGSPSR